MACNAVQLMVFAQGNRMNAMRLPVKGEERREKGAPGLLFRPAPGKNAVCFRRTIADRRFYPSLFSLHPSRNRFMRLPCVALSLTRYSVIIDGLIAPAVFGAI